MKNKKDTDANQYHACGYTSNYNTKEQGNMTAKEMFEKLVYMQEQKYDEYAIKYVYPMKEYGMKVVRFDLTEKIYSVLSISVSGNATTAYIYPELHEAITQQMKELGWIE